MLEKLIIWLRGIRNRLHLIWLKIDYKLTYSYGYTSIGSRAWRSPFNDLVCLLCGGWFYKQSSYAFKKLENRDFFDWILRTPEITQEELDEIPF